MVQKNQLIEFWREKCSFREVESKAFEEIHREDFIPPEIRHRAYDDVPLPLMRGKTISQPTTVMVMTTALRLQPGEHVFEIGSGSGYQAAIIANLVQPVGKVITTEVIPELVQFARANLKKAGLDNVEVIEDDGAQGIANQMFDKIIITAACKEFPPSLLDQLKPNGTIIGPVGDRNEQEMVCGTKLPDGTLQLEFMGQFLFTPMYGKYGFEI